MSAIEILDTGLIYRNPKPHVHAIQALFPSVVRLNDGEMLAAVALAEAFDAVNMHTYLCRSQDGGESWQLESYTKASHSPLMQRESQPFPTDNSLLWYASMIAASIPTRD